MNRSTLTRPGRRTEFSRRLHTAQEDRRSAVIRRRWNLLGEIGGAFIIIGFAYLMFVGLWSVFQ